MKNIRERQQIKGSGRAVEMSRRAPIIQDESNTDPELEPLVPSDPTCPEKPAPFDFLTENVYYSETLTSRERKKAKRMVCECQFDPEQDDPEDACGENCLNRLLMIECGSRCPCGEYCTNKRFQRGAYSQVEVFKTKKKGWGLHTLTNVAQGAFVMEYCGEVISPFQFEERKKQYTIEKRRHYYFMSLRSDEILDATLKGNYSRFINHSCSPNCETQKWTVQGRLRIGFFTVKEIMAGEEITFDYQFQRFGDVAQRCYCGSSNCRGYLGQSKQATPLRTATTRSLRDVGSPREGGGGWRRRHTVRAENREDSMFEKQMYDIVGSGWRLRNTDQVISISRIMLQAESIGQRVMLLHVLQATEDQACLRKFLSLHGLRLLWSWMVDSPEPETLPVLHFREQVLQVLNHLPITTRNQLANSHLVTMVTRWLKLTTKPPEQVSSITSQPQQSAVQSERPHSAQQPAVESSIEATVVTEADSNMDSEVGKMEEEVGSCDSVGVVMPKSCDTVVDSNNSRDSQQDCHKEQQLVPQEEGGDVKKETSLDAVEDTNKGGELTEESHTVMETNVGTNQEEGVVMNLLSDRPHHLEGDSHSNVAVMESHLGSMSEVVKNDVSSDISHGLKEDNVEETHLGSNLLLVRSHDQEENRNSNVAAMESRLGSKQEEGVVGMEASHDSGADTNESQQVPHISATEKEPDSESNGEEGVAKEGASCDPVGKSHDQEHDSQMELHLGSKPDESEVKSEEPLSSNLGKIEQSPNAIASNPQSTDDALREQEVLSCDINKAEGSVDMASPDRELESHDVQVMSHSKEDENTPSHNEKVESHGAAITPSQENKLAFEEISVHKPHNVEVVSHVDAESSHDESHDMAILSDDVEPKSHDMEVTSDDKTEKMEIVTYGKESESHDIKVATDDEEMESQEIDVASHDKVAKSHEIEMNKEVESHDMEVESGDKEMESRDNEVKSHDMEHDREVESDDKRSQENMIASRAEELNMQFLEVKSQDDAEVISHDKGLVEAPDSKVVTGEAVLDDKGLAAGMHLALYAQDKLPNTDADIPSHDLQVESHDIMKAGPSSPEINDTSPERESQSHDNQVTLQAPQSTDPNHENISETQQCEYADEGSRVGGDGESHPRLVSPPNEGENRPIPHSKLCDLYDGGPPTDSDAAAGRDLCVTSSEEQPPTQEESHDNVLISHDGEAKSRDSDAKSHDVEQSTQVVLSNTEETKSHDANELCENEAKSPKVKPCDHKANSCDHQSNPHDSDAKSHDIEQSTQAVLSNTEETKSHDADELCENEAKSAEVKPCDHEAKSCDHQSNSHDREVKVCENETQSHDGEATKSHDMEVKSHDSEAKSCDSVSSPHDREVKSSDNGVISHDKAKSCDSQSSSHDREVKSCDNDVKSKSSESGDYNEVMSCEAEAKQVGGGEEDDAFMVSSNRVVTMATELLEKWEGLKEVFRIPKRTQTVKMADRQDSPCDASDSGGLRETEGEGEGHTDWRRKTPKGSGKKERRSERRSAERGNERKRRWDHWNRSPPPPDPPVARQHQGTPPTWSGKRKVLLPKPKNIFPSAIPRPLAPSYPPAPSPLTAGTASISTAPVQSPYVITQQNTGASFTSSTRFPTPPIPVQNTVIVQQGGQSVYVQQQVYQDGCQTTIMPTQYIPPPIAQPFVIPPLQASQSTALHPPPAVAPPTFTVAPPTFSQAPPTITHAPPTLTQAPNNITQVPLAQVLPTPHPHLPILPTLPNLPSLPPQIPPTGFIRPDLSQVVPPQMLIAPPISQSSVTPFPSLPLPPPPPSDTGLPHNWRSAKDPKGKTYYYHVITRKSQWTCPTAGDADGSVTMELASSSSSSSSSSSDEEGASCHQAMSLRAPRTPDGTPPPLTMTTEKNYDTESTDATPSPCPSPTPHPHIPHSPHSHKLSPNRSPLPSPHTPPLVLPPPSTPPPGHQQHFHSSHVTSLPGPSTPPLSPSHSPTTTPPLSPSPRPPPEKRAKVTKTKEQKQKELFKHKVSRVVTQCLDQHRKPDCKYGRITCSEDFKYLARKLTHGLAEKELQRRYGSADNLVFNNSIRTRVKEYIRQYMKKSGPVYTRL